MKNALCLLLLLGLSACVTARDFRRRCHSEDGLCTLDLDVISRIHSDFAQHHSLEETANQILQISPNSEKVELELLRYLAKTDARPEIIKSKYLSSVLQLHSNETGTENDGKYSSSGYIKYLYDHDTKSGTVAAIKVKVYETPSGEPQYAIHNTRGKYELKNESMEIGHLSWDSVWERRNGTMTRLGNATIFMWGNVTHEGNGKFVVTAKHFGVDNNTVEVAPWEDTTNGTMFSDQNGGNWTSASKGNSTWSQGTLNFTNSASGTIVRKGDTSDYHYEGVEQMSMPGHNFTLTIKASGNYVREPSSVVVFHSEDSSGKKRSHNLFLNDLINMLL